MEQYTVNLANGQSYTITATSPAQAASLANETAQESGNQVVSVTRLGSNTPITTNLPDGTAVSFTNEVNDEQRRAELERQRLQEEERGRLEEERLKLLEQENQFLNNQSRTTGMIAAEGVQGAPTFNAGPDLTNLIPPQTILGDVDPIAAFTRSLGLTQRPVSDPYRNFLSGQFGSFFNPFRFQNVVDASSVGPNPLGLFESNVQSAPGFEDFLTSVRNPLQARQAAANTFSNILGTISGGGFTPGSPGSILGDVLGVQAQATPFNLLGETPRNIIQEFGNLGRQALQNRVGTAAFNLIGGALPSVQDLYTDYFTRAQAGEQVAPTFAEALSGAYGLGG